MVLENEVVQLRELTIADVDALCDVAFYPEIWSYLSSTLQSRQDVVQFIEKAVTMKEKGSEYPFVIIEKRTNKIVGSTRYMEIDLVHQRLEIGTTWLTPSVWRTAINTNCKLLLLTHCFEVIGLKRVQIKTDAENERSRQAITRIGATFEGILRQHMTRKDGTTRDTAMFSVIATDWPNVKQQLQILAGGGANDDVIDSDL